MADPEQLIPKNRFVTYIGTFVELYNCRNDKQIYKIYRMIEFEKMYTLIIKNLCKLKAHEIIEVSSVLHSAYLVFKDQKKFVFYINNFIN